MNECPCCAHRMLRHVRHREIYWFCSSCWQEMPNFFSSSNPSPIVKELLVEELLDNRLGTVETLSLINRR